MAVVILGPASWNTVVRLDRLPEPRPHTVFARESLDTLGGTSAGKALHLADLGLDVVLCTVVGDDEKAACIEGALQHERVRLILERTGGPSERHCDLMTDSGERISLYLSVPRPPTGAPPAEVLSAIAGADEVVVDLAPRTLDALPAVRASGARVWTDLHDYDGASAFHRPFLQAADMVFMNADALGDPRPFMAQAVAGGAAVAVCTLGADGAIALEADGTTSSVRAVPTRVVDANGAGDAFLAGFLAATRGGAAVPSALQAGADQAVRAVSSRHLSPLLEGHDGTDAEDSTAGGPADRRRPRPVGGRLVP